MHRQMRDVLAVEYDLAGICAEQSGEHVEQRRFAGAVRADQAVQPVRMHIELHIRRDDQRAETFVQTAHCQDRLVRMHGALLGVTKWCDVLGARRNAANAPASSVVRVAAGAAPRLGSLPGTAGRTG